jgi:hypothetical protein
LVADEVGLGKTLVAQGVIEGLQRQGRAINVFYVCSSLSIATQNCLNLLEILPPHERERARVEVDRLTLTPKISRSRFRRRSGFNLFTLTPGTLPGRGRTGRVDERALIWYLIRRTLPALRGSKRLDAELRRSVRRTRWKAQKREVKQEIGPRLAGALQKRFRQLLAEQLELSRAARRSTITRRVGELLKDDPKELVGRGRYALTLAAVERLRPDLIIFDEFQRFFELLIPPEDDPDADRSAYELVRRFIAAPPKEGRAARLLLLSATPYPLFSRWAEGGPERHHDQFFRLLRFLHGEGAGQVDELRDAFLRYAALLQQASPGDREVFAVKRGIEQDLLRVMARTERAGLGEPAEQAEGEKALRGRYQPAQLRHLDIRVFLHLVEAARADHRHMAESVWSSVPFPLQMMTADEYLLRQHAAPSRLRGPDRAVEVRFRDIRRYRALELPHPRLRALLQDVPARLLSLPWLPPTRPWWPLGGLFQSVRDELPASRLGKALIFSRFRAVPRALAGVLSYEAERYVFGVRNGGAGAFDYAARRRSRREGGMAPVAGLRAQPQASFDFPGLARLETALRLVPMFFPMPTLARLGDPLEISGAAAGRLTLERARRAVRERLTEQLGGPAAGRRSRPIWRWLVTLERRHPRWERTREAWLKWADDAGTRFHRAAARTIRRFVDEEPFPAKEVPIAAELDELAELALTAPGTVLFRAVGRVFGSPAPADRLTSVTRATVECLRGYLDTPEFHRLLGSGRSRAHGEAIRHAVWDGNLESVLDEYLVMLRGLGVEKAPEGREERALEALMTALSIRASTVEVRRILGGKRRFRLRCHAALPLGLAREEVVFSQGRAGAGGRRLRADFVRVAFNSPFRPFALATTSIGQEGLDFHVYCGHVIHWDVPWNPVAVEQREGRVRRYGSLAIRRALAASVPVRLETGTSPWIAIGRAAAQASGRDGHGGLMPWWSWPGAEMCRTVYVPPLSRQRDDMERLLKALALYRLALGQPDQEHLVQALGRRLEEAGSDRSRLLAWLGAAMINLSPYQQVGRVPARTRRGRGGPAGHAD